jgi:CRP-like cAMP-binding protein
MSLTQDKRRKLSERFLLPLLRRLVDLPDAEWEFLADHLRLVRLDPGERFTQFGEVADRFGVVTEGVLCKRHLVDSGESFVRGFAAEADLVGAYVSLLTEAPSELSVEAVTRAEVLAVPYAVMDILYSRHACWERIGRRLAESFLIEREYRAAQLLTCDATARYLDFLTTHNHLIGRVREADVASYLGITPVSLSRIKARLRVQGQLV